MKKFAFAILFLISFSALASVTPYQRRLVREIAIALTGVCGAEPELSPEITRFKIISVNDTRITAEATYVEFGPFYGTFQYTYDLSTRSVIPGSVRCISNDPREY